MEYISSHNGITTAVPSGRVNVLGVGISAISMDDAVRMSDGLIASNGKGYVCVTGVHGVTEAQNDPEFRKILNESFLTTPDGMPMVWIGKLRGFSNMTRVYGPDFMVELCRAGAERGYTHFLYGGKDGVVDHLRRALEEKIPGVRIVGAYTPPFRALTQDEENTLLQMVSRIRPDIFWIGLSTPKQERFMARYWDKLDTKMMVGVGAAFDLHTGNMKDAPDWMKQAGLQWLHRLCQEPKRLWKRYLINNPIFVYRMCLQLLGIRAYE